MQINIKAYILGKTKCYRAGYSDGHSVYTLKENNPYKRGSVEWQSYRKGYLDEYTKRRREGQVLTKQAKRA